MRQRLRILPAIGDDLAQLGIAKIGEIHFIQLEIAAACLRKGTGRLAIGVAKIAIEIIHDRID